ncbi:MAG: 30S ribosomal protein S4 [Candidatus Bathyarchaeia archaeon]
MGDPKKKHKKYTSPKLPFDQGALLEELRLLGAYGLRNKKELWRLRTQLSRFRRSAREIESMSSMEKRDKEKALLSRLRNLGLLGESATLDDVLSLRIEDLLERRLQTIVYRRKMAKSFFQARQLITHGHVSISGRKAISPSYWVTMEDEKKISYNSSSPLSSDDHPLRKELSV